MMGTLQVAKSAYPRFRFARFAAATAGRHRILVVAVDGAGNRSSFLLRLR
jgi:hypothetical protein